ncbi:MAG: beta-lactamase family protein [Gammaproteobacteria bacterium]|nr:beta-lactamase family protein [Gammaproteobacteria bacterium]MDH3429972.1 beta-lactamase family protein [Gammaproteobacteria bacterium]MDH3481330.1 beta-lactamase family protein [Gammaproteobacteria bacterium]
MKRLTKMMLGGASACLLTIGSHAADLGDPAALEAYIDGIVAPLMKFENSPSGTVAISLDGEVILAKGYGFENLENQVPVDPARTLFRPGSVSKLFTWTAVMQLVEQGELDLDTDVNTYLQSFRIKETFDEPITLRHILTHTPGFEDGGLGYLIIDDPEKTISLREAMQRYQPERVNPPGVQTAYSNYATALAGLIVENVSGLPFNDYVQRNILDPLGMSNSTFAEPLPAHLAERMATSYKVEAGAFDEKPFEIVANFGPAGALSATATDMLRFAQAILNGGELDGVRILRAETVEQMLTRNFTHDERLSGMALGFYESDYNGSRVVGHGGDTQWFHSDLAIDLDKNLAIFASFGGSGGRVPRSAIVGGIYDRYFPRSEEPPVPPDDFNERAARYAGTYAFWRGNFSKIERAFGIANAVQVAPTKDNTLIVAFADGAKQYAEVEKNLFRERNPGISLVAGISPRQIAFQEDDSGVITGFVMDGLAFMSLRKLPFYATPNFNFSLLGLALLVMLGFVLRRYFQRREIAGFDAADRSAIRAAFIASTAHLAVVVLGAVVISTVMDNLINGLPLLFKTWLVLPIIATAATLYLAYKMVVVWKGQLLTTVWARIRYSIVTLAGLFMGWFYSYWNILGFQYL